MKLHFTKMQALGNDFMVIDGINQSLNNLTLPITAWSNRHTGIGFDQCLIIKKSTKPDIDFFYQIFNADGQEVGQCGNGARCLARFVEKNKLSTKKTLRIETLTTQMTLQLNHDDSVTVDMGHPQFAPALIPLHQDKECEWYTLTGLQKTYTVHALSVGNPHAVLVIDDVDNADVDGIGQQLTKHPDFPEQTNVEFMQVCAKDHIKLRVYERGCAETQACGSGAVAAVAAGRRFHQLEANVRVSLPGGELLVHWPDLNQTITLTGPALFVYEGEINYNTPTNPL